MNFPSTSGLTARGASVRVLAQCTGDSLVLVCDQIHADEGNDCDTVCRIEECGNGRQETNEQCDDGNQNDGDGRTSVCVLEP